MYVWYRDAGISLSRSRYPTPTAFYDTSRNIYKYKNWLLSKCLTWNNFFSFYFVDSNYFIYKTQPSYSVLVLLQLTRCISTQKLTQKKSVRSKIEIPIQVTRVMNILAIPISNNWKHIFNYTLYTFQLFIFQCPIVLVNYNVTWCPKLAT